MSLRELARLYDIIGFCGKILFKCGWFSIRNQFLDSIFLMFGFAGLNSVTKGNMFCFPFGLFFNDALLPSNLTSARVSLIRDSMYPLFERRFLKLLIWVRNFFALEFVKELNCFAFYN